MKKNLLLRTNIMVCLVIILGFLATSTISYCSNLDICRKDVEQVSYLTSEGIYNKIDSYFTKPIHISLTMANDHLLKTLLQGESQRLEDETFIQSLQEYLNAYQETYHYNSVFLVSSATGRYYHFNGLQRVLTLGNPENNWYFSFLETEDAYDLNIDNDEADGNEITVFVNCKIKDTDGTVLGVVGVGFRADPLQALLKHYETQFGISANLVDQAGITAVSSRETGYQNLDFFAHCDFPKWKDAILSARAADEPQTFWFAYSAGYVVARYIPTLNWHLVIENHTPAMNHQLKLQFYGSILVILVILVFVLFLITDVIGTYNTRIIHLAVTQEQERKTAFQEATEHLFENIYELDITHNQAVGEATKQYFESLGASRDAPYDQALHQIANQQIKEPYRQGYLDTFSPEAVLAAYERGIKTLRYDFMMAPDGHTYYWVRATARIFRWEEDGSIRMLVYRQNIDAEKQYEWYLYEQTQKDSFTNLYNKAAIQERIRILLASNPSGSFAFFILDLDHFKQINDQFGHVAGDATLAKFARMIKSQFRESDLIGRIGGDEFAVFFPAPDRSAVEKKARDLHAALSWEIKTETSVYQVSSSIGIALSPAHGTDFETLYRNADIALYQAKNQGKNGFFFFEA